MSALDNITSSLAEHRLNEWYFKRWQRDNKIEAPKVIAYLDGGARPPTTAVQTHYGLGLLLAEDARRELYPSPPPPPATDSPIPPAPPKAYSIPAGAYVPSSFEDFRIRVASGGAVDIVVPNGVDTKPTTGALVFGAAHRLWGASLLGNMLQYGLASVHGMELHGVRVKLVDESHVLSTQPAAVSQWGGRLVVQDSEIDVNRMGKDSAADAANSGVGSNFGTPIWGIWSKSTGGAIIERAIVKGATSDGILLGRPAYGGAADRVWDVLITDARRPTQGNSYGRSEAGLRLDYPAVANGVKHVEIRRCGYGVVTLGSAATTFSDLLIDDISLYQKANGGTGFYIEQGTRSPIIENSYIGPNVWRPITVEWDTNVSDVSAANIIVRDSTLDTSAHPFEGSGGTRWHMVGFYADDSNSSPPRNHEIYGVKFIGCPWGGIGFNQVAGSTQHDNDFSGRIGYPAGYCGSTGTVDHGRDVRTNVHVNSC